ncbi:sensor histidine kinase [Thermosediminibacter litoriperuensis]|uniref:histidine kinase n=1 Tax=Thermosediminibacter litoriperuensis TaxID=291989 RepID=A0A5S5AQA3_9FIRM|nr:HAMP domain-containing sensor histidine kinase [Thermosediminibacter litoriperuensis]TYP54211.1 signal transduction histidine kinase [Thermosediminibacter litoriperuensis]
MKIFINKEVKKLFITLAGVSIIFIILGQVAIMFSANDYKQNMLQHDYEVAGYMRRRGIDKLLIIRSFTCEKSNEDIEAGRKLLQMAGYNSEIQNNLLPSVERFYQKNAAISLALFITFSVTSSLTILFFVLQHYKRIEEADLSLRDFMAGNTNIRLDELGEDSLHKLFATINSIVTSQVAHIEREKQNRKFLKDTISDISHQLKTPLAALKMYNEIILNENIENNVVKSFSLKIEREIIRMESLIQNLLKLAKLDAGSIKLEKSTHNLKDFLREVIEGFRTRAEIECKKIILDCDEHIVMNFDKEWLLEALSNIIKNALDHTEAQDKIEVHCTETPALILITIKDNGTGIHPEDIPHIFKRFYRSRFSKDKHGVGIGLTLAKTIIEMHGGIVTVESEVGKGTAFNLIFPKLSNL